MAETSEPLEPHHMRREHVNDIDEDLLSIYKYGDRAEVCYCTFKMLTRRNIR
jgi:hypothetical protein